MADFTQSLVGGVGSAVGGSLGGAAGGMLTQLLMPDKTPDAKKLGSQQRDYLDAAFPQLNQWEQAGAGQQGASTANSAQSTNERIANKQMAMQQQVSASTVEKNKAESDLIRAKADNERNATSGVGKVVKDVSGIGSKIFDGLVPQNISTGVKSAIDNLVSPSKAFTQSQKPKRLSINMGYSAKARRKAALEVQLIKAKTPEQKALIQKRLSQLK